MDAVTSAASPQPVAFRRTHALAAAALYAALSVLSTWPLVSNITTHLPRGSESVATVPFVSAWALWWTSDRAANRLVDYWQAPIFHPAPDTFAMSEPMPLAGFAVTPLLWLGAPLALATNLFLLAALWLNGWTAMLLLRAARLLPLAAIGGGASVCMLPVLHHQLGVPTLVPVFGLVLALHAALRTMRAPSLSRGLALGSALAASYLLCAQYALLLAIGLIPLLIGTAIGRIWRAKARARALLRYALAGAITALAFGLAVSLLVIAQMRLRSEQQLEHTPDQLKRGSAFLRSYWKSPPEPLIEWPRLRIDRKSGTSLYPGSLRLILGLGVLAWVVQASAKRRSPAAGTRVDPRRKRRVRPSLGRRRALHFLGALMLIEFFVSVASHLPLGAYTLRDPLAALIPGVGQIRSLWRAGVIVGLCIALLAPYALHFLYLRCRWSVRGHRFASGLVIALAALASLEVWPPPQALSAVPDPRLYAGWADFMNRALGPNEPYCVLPWPKDGSVAAYEDVSRFMLLTALHGRPMVNGYSSYFPAPHERLERARPQFGRDSTAALLRHHGVRYAVVRNSAVDPARAGSWRRVFADPAADVSVYALPPVSGSIRSHRSL